MILYSTVGTVDMERPVKFYDAVFGALGVARAPNWIDGWAGWGRSYDEGYGFWICRPFDWRVPTTGNGTMFAFRAENEAQVHAFHIAALEREG
jgi:catechol 2,3-dioxygenase-like lactoylglutathione lyase family enzyme